VSPYIVIAATDVRISANPPSKSDGLLNFRPEIFDNRLFAPQTGQTVVRVGGHQGSDSVSISHPPLKPLPDPIPLKIQFPISNKQLPYDEAIRVPLLVRWPGRLTPHQNDALIGLVDLPVTLLGLMGLAFPQPVHGADLQSIFRSQHAPGCDACYILDYIPAHQAYHRGGEAWRGVRTHRHTLARKATGAEWLLFDNESDPWQMRNLNGDPQHADLQADLERQLDVFIERHDRLLPGDEFIRRFKFEDAWNRSQQHFNLPLLDSARAGG